MTLQQRITAFVNAVGTDIGLIKKALPVIGDNTNTFIPLNNYQTVIPSKTLTANIVLTPKIDDAIESGSAIFTITPGQFTIDVSAFVDFGSADLTNLIVGKPVTYYFFRLGGIDYVIARTAPVNLSDTAPLIIGDTGLVLNEVTATTAAFSWSQGANATGAIIERYLMVDHSDQPVIAYNGSDLSSIDTGLAAETNYYYKKRNTDGINFSNPAYIIATTLVNNYTEIGYVNFKLGSKSSGNIAFHENDGLVYGFNADGIVLSNGGYFDIYSTAGFDGVSDYKMTIENCVPQLGLQFFDGVPEHSYGSTTNGANQVILLIKPPAGNVAFVGNPNFSMSSIKLEKKN